VALGDSGLVSLRRREAVSSVYRRDRRAGNARRGEGRSEPSIPPFDMTDGVGIPFRSSKTWRQISQKALILKRASWRVGRGSPEKRASPALFSIRRQKTQKESLPCEHLRGVSQRFGVQSWALR